MMVSTFPNSQRLIYALFMIPSSLESVCFAILIGISCDFVIHFSHSYASLKGRAPRQERTKHALIHMGPSILAAAFTTIAAATVMLFTVISFFEKFALILFLTVLQATIGSFVVFLTLCDCIGPAQPTYLFDMVVEKCSGKQDDKKENDRGLTTDDDDSNNKSEETHLSIIEPVASNDSQVYVGSSNAEIASSSSDEYDAEIWT